jgi:polyhydroxyalkanoate synthesis regulator phasin
VEPSNDRLLTEIAELQKAVGKLWQTVDEGKISTTEESRKVSDKLDTWIDTNRVLLESNQELLKVIVLNSQEVQRSAQSYEKGSRLLTQLQQQLSSFEQVTTELSEALESLELPAAPAIPESENQNVSIEQFSTYQENLKQTLQDIQSLQQNLAESIEALLKKTGNPDLLKALKTRTCSTTAIDLTTWKDSLLTPAALPIAIFSVVMVAIGAGLGWASTQLAKPELAPGAPRQLTLDEAETLRWAKSREGKLARNLVQWNDDLLANLDCTKDVDRLGVTLNVQGKPSTFGYCALWVVPPEQRKFDESKKN